MNQLLERSSAMSLIGEDFARAHLSARLDRARQERQYASLATANRLSRRAERLTRRAERAAAQARLALARAI